MMDRKSKAHPEEEPASAEPTIRPTLESVSPRWAALRDKWAELARREEEILVELKPFVEKVGEAGGSPPLEPIVSPPAPPEPQEHPPEVTKLLGALTPPKKKREPVRKAFSADKEK